MSILANNSSKSRVQTLKGDGATLQICKAGVARMRKIWFSRHGESEYNMFAKIGGDSNISPQGQVYAKLLPDLMVDRVPLVSSCKRHKQRTSHTH